jgi:hypothetical protein
MFVKLRTLEASIRDALDCTWDAIRYRRALAGILEAGKRWALDEWLAIRFNLASAAKLAPLYFEDPQSRGAATFEGITEDMLIASAYCKHMGSLEALSRLIVNAENRRNEALKYIEERQWVLGQKLRAASDKLIDNDTPRIAAPAPENTTTA